jgi:hypothetical protein
MTADQERAPLPLEIRPPGLLVSCDDTVSNLQLALMLACISWAPKSAQLTMENIHPPPLAVRAYSISLFQSSMVPFLMTEQGCM